jgi:hypothetical protein
MKLTIYALGTVALMTFSAATFAAPGLTPQQCHEYPFVQPVHGVTHAELMQELAELEAVGYHPSPDDPYYPRQIQRAEHKLHAEYRQDCMTPGGSSNG